MYIDAALLPDNRLWVSEKTKDGKRQVRSQLPPYVFYFADPDGSFKSIYGDNLKRVHNTNKWQFQRELDQFKVRGIPVFESDVNPIYRHLEEKYGHSDETPELNIGIVDIEVDKDPARGFARVKEPYAPITALTIYKKLQKLYVTLIVPPPNLTVAEARALLDGRAYQDVDGKLIYETPKDSFGEMTEAKSYFVCESEAELITVFLDLIEDIDVLTGWNSTFYDIPYIIQRIRMVLGEEPLDRLMIEDGTPENPYNPSEESIPYLMKMCLFPTVPRLRHVDHFGGVEKVYDLYGRPHLDYLELYMKFPHEELHSYSLDFVLKHEVKQSKIAYDGSLDQLYRLNLRTFTAYNRQDVAGLNALDEKKKYIELANQMAHMAGVTMNQVLGSVVIIEQAILKRLHKDKLICFDKSEKLKELPVPGAFVVDPQKGDYRCIASYDFNSLYPTTIRLINISPDTLIGQFDLSATLLKWRKLFEEINDAAETWAQFTGVLEYHWIMDETDEPLTLIIEGTGEQITAPAREWKQILKESNWSISANGTVFDLSREGIVTKCMTEWYAERQRFQAQKKKYGLAQKDEQDPDKLKELKEQEAFYDMIQQAKKLFLNSTYGAYLNEYFRFYDPRLGASVTLSGRVMTKHMVKQTSYVMTGNYDFDRRAVIAGDTDSCYATMEWYMNEHKIEITDKNMIKLADELGYKVNASMPPFLEGAFLIPQKRGEILEAGREIVGRRGLFKDKKKRYAIYVIDKEGKSVDEMKIMGMETRRSDTPKYIQEFLTKCLVMVVKENKSYQEVRAYVDEFRAEFHKRADYQLGSPGRVKNLTTTTRKKDQFDKLMDKGFVGMKKPTSGFAVKAAINTNMLMEYHNEHRWDLIRDGDKVESLYLLPNDMDLDVVAIRTGETYVPDWFKALPVDRARMEQKLIDQKLFNVLGDILGWNFQPESNYASDVFEENTNFYGVLD